jgi:hypothetical protein
MIKLCLAETQLEKLFQVVIPLNEDRRIKLRERLEAIIDLFVESEIEELILDIESDYPFIDEKGLKTKLAMYLLNEEVID